MIEIKETRNKFKNIIIYINENHIYLNEIIKECLKELIDLWKNSKGKGIEYFSAMKNYHSYINNRFSNVILNNMWLEYIQSCSLLRAKMIFDLMN